MKAEEVLKKYRWKTEDGVEHYLDLVHPVQRVDGKDDGNIYYMCNVCDKEHPLGKAPQKIFGVTKSEDVFECTQKNTPYPYPAN